MKKVDKLKEIKGKLKKENKALGERFDESKKENIKMKKNLDDLQEKDLELSKNIDILKEENESLESRLNANNDRIDLLKLEHENAVVALKEGKFCELV